MNMHLVGCLFTKSQAADFPFLETKKNIEKESRLSTCRPVSGKNVAEAIIQARIQYDLRPAKDTCMQQMGIYLWAG